MARATGLSSQFRGKVGNVVGYLTKNRAGRYEQTVKAYQPVVANPQSYAQALARVPVGPVQRICSALLPLIQRGFEGTAYGDPSKSEFLSYNLKYFRGPYMVKGAVEVPPGPMLLSKGSLAGIALLSFEDDGLGGIAEFDLSYRLPTANRTKGAIASELLTRNTQLGYGEQLTFIVVALQNGEYQYHYESLFLDPNDDSYPRGLLIGAGDFEHYFSIAIDDSPYSGTIVAAACIRSQAYGTASFKRSTAFLVCDQNAELYNDEAAVQAAVASYRTGEDPEDWEDDPTPEYQKLAYLCMVTITDYMVITASSPARDGTKCLGYVTKGGEFGIFYTYSAGYSANVLLNDKAEILKGNKDGISTPFYYNSSYDSAREYSSIYGTM